MNQGDLIQDRYQLEESLGKGGMAEVWRAVDRRLERSVAIKFLAPNLTADPEFLVRFFAEAQSVARLSHPNVVAVLDFGEADDSPYLVMEHVPGGALSNLTGEPVQPERAAEIVRDAALGAGAAHELGIVHRDIKPGNVLLCDDGRATIADFGIALTAFSEKMTATGQVIGSPHYISPEQATGKGSRPQSDVYALGIVLYELLTGRPPFDADNATAIAIAHVDQEPEPPSARGVELDPELEAVVMRCLSKDPSNRFANGTVLASALEGAVPSLTGLAPVLAASATAPIAADLTATSTGAAVGSEIYDSEASGPRRGVQVAAGVLVIALLGTGAWAMLRDSKPTPASASESTTERKKGPPPTPSASRYRDKSGNWVATEPSPSATPEPDQEEASGEQVGVVVDRESDGGGNGGGTYEEPQEEEPVESSPSPDSSSTPEEEPTTEPTPEPSEPPE